MLFWLSRALKPFESINFNVVESYFGSGGFCEYYTCRSTLYACRVVSYIVQLLVAVGNRLDYHKCRTEARIDKTAIGISVAGVGFRILLKPSTPVNFGRR